MSEDRYQSPLGDRRERAVPCSRGLARLPVRGGLVTDLDTDMAPGVYRMTNEEYHADPVPGGSLSSSGARKLLPPSCPAIFQYEREHGQEPKIEFDIGHAAHKLVLGDGPELVVVDADSWRTNAAKDAAKEARERGAVPLLPDDHAQVEAMAAALREHPVAAALFDPDRGTAEESLFWRDQPTGIMRRARLDWLPEPGRGRLIIPDYKTCASADPDALAKSVHRFGYHQQASFYLDGVQALGLGDETAAFVFVCQEKKAPYLVTIIELDAMALRIGGIRNRRAIDIFVECTATNHWPGYSDGIELLSLPAWAELQEGGDQ